MKELITRRQYDKAFIEERMSEYPMIDDYEKLCGFALNRHKLEEAARVLACPVKKNPPNWQHGRVIYSTLRSYMTETTCVNPLHILDVGTAKGFSALCALWAVQDADQQASIVSVDVINPDEKVRRNTVSESVCGYQTLYETLAPWPETKGIEFKQSTGVAHLSNQTDLINFAFLDGKHERKVVAVELFLLGNVQMSGDIVILDDVQIPGVEEAILDCRDSGHYRFTFLSSLPTRTYAIGIKN